MHMYTYMYVCVCVCMYTCVYIYIYIYPSCGLLIGYLLSFRYACGSGNAFLYVTTMYPVVLSEPARLSLDASIRSYLQLLAASPATAEL